MGVATGRAVEALEVFARTIETDEPESDGTLEWNSTTIVVVKAHSDGAVGVGYTYTHEAAARLIDDKLAPLVRGAGLDDLTALWEELGRQLRNIGRPGIGFMALSAVDIALWDLEARLLDVPLADLLGAVRDEAAVYGSGGFSSYSLERLVSQLAGWAEQGIPRVKMKLGREPQRDPARLDAARAAIGDESELYVDANGAFSRDDAVEWARRYADEWGVSWFEEPVSSADLDGLRVVREGAPLDVAAGEYAFVPADFRNLLEARCVDCRRSTSHAAAGTQDSSAPPSSPPSTASTSPRTVHRRRARTSAAPSLTSAISSISTTMCASSSSSSTACSCRSRERCVRIGRARATASW